MAYFFLSLFIANHALSTGLRTVHALMADGVSQDLGLRAAELGAFAGAYNITFALMQIPIGVALDRYGPKRVCAGGALITASGAFISAAAPNFPLLLLGQAIVGIGCAPALMGGFVFAGNWFEENKFGAISSIMISLGSIGIIATSAPLAYLLEAIGWRGAFWVLGGLAIFMAIILGGIIKDRPDHMPPHQSHKEPIWQTFRGVGSMLLDYRLLGLLIIGLTAYPIKLTIRSVWIGPYFSDIHTLSPLAVGELTLIISIAVVAGPSFAPLLEKFMGRVGVIAASVLAGGAMLAAFPFLSGQSAWIDTAFLSVAIVILGCYVLTYASARRRFPAEYSGRALATLNFSIFAGAAIWQLFTGALLDAVVPTGSSPDLQAYDIMYVVMGGAAIASGLVYLFTRPAPSRESSQ